MSTRSLGLKYTAQGLGDRVHLVSLCYEISKTQSEIVTLHLAMNHLGGKKRDSFLEILNLFPNSLVKLRFHESDFQTTTEWKNYLTQEGILALSFEYRDHPGWLEKPSDIDASSFLSVSSHDKLFLFTIMNDASLCELTEKKKVRCERINYTRLKKWMTLDGKREYSENALIKNFVSIKTN